MTTTMTHAELGKLSNLPRGREMIVSKKISFDAAHYLPNYAGKCSQMHGHHWVVELGVKGFVGEDGMVIDFTTLKNFLSQIKANLDHYLLNDTIPNPTAENVALYIKVKYYQQDWGFKEVQLAFIKVWETEDSCCTLEVPSKI